MKQSTSNITPEQATAAVDMYRQSALHGQSKPAIAGPTLQNQAGGVSAWQDGWIGRRDVVHFMRDPRRFARGFIRECHRQNVSAEKMAAAIAAEVRA